MKQTSTTKRRRPRRSGRSNGTPKLVIVRSPHYMPDRLRTTLRFNAEAAILNAGINFGSIRYTPTNAFDVDPVLGSTSMPGFAELGAIYRFYRINKFKVKLSAGNREAFVNCICLAVLNFDPGANTANWQNYFSSRDSVKKYMGPLTGACTTELAISGSVASEGGSNTRVMVNDAYSALTSGAPSNNMWIFIGTHAVGNAQAAGVEVSTQIDIELDFFEIASPPT